MDENPVILFDGVCQLCSASVKFVIERDPAGHFRFARLQSEFSRRLLTEHGAADSDLDSVILIHRGKLYRKSRAVLHTALHLNRGWPLMGALLLVPRFIADPVYDWIGRHRYRWFGRMDTCWLPLTDQRWRFLDMEDANWAPVDEDS
jgi:predicted DCC family thiol-disulfide oxidoreductase YuxK